MMNKIFFSNVAIGLYLLMVCLFVLFQSPLIPVANSSVGIDSSVFIYCARQILNGQLMYKDIIDHKGPVLYLLDMAGLVLYAKNWIGIWILELVSLFVTGLVLYKTSRLFAGKGVAVLAAMTSLLFLCTTIGGGNLTEEWALPFLCIAQYVFIRYLKYGTPLTVGGLFAIAFTFVIAFMLRANLVALWGGYGIVLCAKWLIEKKYRELVYNVVGIILFVALLILPFFLYFYFTDTLSDALYCVFVFNLVEYSHHNLLRFVVSVLSVPMVISSVALLFMFFTQKPSFLLIAVLAVYLISVLSCSLGGSYLHYFMIFCPVFVIPYMNIFKYLQELSVGIREKMALTGMIFLMLNATSVFSQCVSIKDNLICKTATINNLSPQQRAEIVNCIRQYSAPEDKILVADHLVPIYLYANRQCATRFPYPLNNSSLERENYLKDAIASSPKLIIRTFGDKKPESFDVTPLLNSKYRKIPFNLYNLEIWSLEDATK